MNHTFIDVGWWMQYYLPLPLRSTLSPKAKEMAHVRPTGGAARNLLTNLHHIGTWVARILADPRTRGLPLVLETPAYDEPGRLGTQGMEVWRTEVEVLNRLAGGGAGAGVGVGGEDMEEWTREIGEVVGRASGKRDAKGRKAVGDGAGRGRTEGKRRGGGEQDGDDEECERCGEGG